MMGFLKNIDVHMFLWFMCLLCSVTSISLHLTVTVLVLYQAEVKQ